jgi:SAM-dependent methyltransferase
MLDLICPAAAAMSKRVGLFVSGLPADAAKRPVSLRVFEIGCGTGATTLALLESREDLVIQAADNEPAMLDQAARKFVSTHRARTRAPDRGGCAVRLAGASSRQSGCGGLGLYGA